MIDMGVISGIALPVGLIGVAALALPLALTPRGTRSQKRLLVSVLLSALGLFVLGGALFAFLYEVDGVPIASLSFPAVSLTTVLSTRIRLYFLLSVCP